MLYKEYLRYENLSCVFDIISISVFTEINYGENMDKIIYLDEWCDHLNAPAVITLSFINPPGTRGYKFEGISCNVNGVPYCPKDYQCEMIQDVLDHSYDYL